MRNKIAVTVLVALLATAAVVFGRRLLRNNHDLVTLNVRNLPIAEVSARIYSQTGVKLNVDPKLDAKVTLNVQDMPLPKVLDMLADQSAGRWSRTFAVYVSKESLGRLEGALLGETSLADAGWTNLAPRFASVDFTPPDPNDPNAPHVFLPGSDGAQAGGQAFSQDDIKKLMQGNGTNGRLVVNSVDVVSDSSKPSGEGGVVVRRSGPFGPGGPGRRVMKRVVMGPDGTASTTTTAVDPGGNVSVMKVGPDGKVVEEDNWSRDRLVMNRPLVPQLGGAIPDKATLETAAASAKRVHGHYAIYYTLDKPPAGWISPGSQSLPPPGPGQDGKFDPARLGNELRNNMGGGIGRLTPEQQVQRARQMRDQQIEVK